MTDERQQRVDQLERDLRWWKRLAIGLIVAFGLILLVGGVSSISLATRARNIARQQERTAMEAVMRARETER